MAGNEAYRLDALTAAVVEVARHAAGRGWDEPPRLYALARKVSVSSAAPELVAELAGVEADGLVPIEQDPLPEGDPDEVLACVHWPAEVEGCALVTEFIMLPDRDAGQVPEDQALAERWAARRPGQRGARLTAGVLRDGQYACCLQYRDDDELVIRSDLADDVVAALLNTF